MLSIGKQYEIGKRNHYPYRGFTLSPWRSRRVAKDGSLYNWVRKSLRTYIDFQNLCENNNLPYYHFQMGDIFERYLDEFICIMNSSNKVPFQTCTTLGLYIQDVQIAMPLSCPVRTPGRLGAHGHVPGDKTI